VPLSINIETPSIVSMTAAHCSFNSTALELMDCPADRTFYMHVCVDDLPLYVNNGDITVQQQAAGMRRMEPRAPFGNRRQLHPPCRALPCWRSYVCSTCLVQPLNDSSVQAMCCGSRCPTV
jgi:hypothetical protein